jgi:hypothetical protein
MSSPTRSLESKIIEEEDEAVLATLGYKQEFKREFSWFQVIGMSFSIIGAVQSIA